MVSIVLSVGARTDWMAGITVLEAWESLGHNQNFMANSEKHALSKDDLTPVMKTLIYLFHVYFAEEPYTALSAPLTEVNIFTVKEGFHNQEFVPLLATYAETLNRVTTEHGGYGGATWGTVVESKKEYVLVFGWKDLEVTMQAALSVQGS